MSNKKLEWEYAAKLEGGLNTVEGAVNKEAGAEELDGLVHLGQRLAGCNFGAEDSKEKVLRQVRMTLQRPAASRRSRSGMGKRIAATAASLAFICMLGVAFAAPSYAGDLWGRVVRTVSLGNITVHQMEHSQPVDGGVSGNVQTEPKGAVREGAGKLVIHNPGELQRYLAFNVALPAYLPQGYAFSRAELYQDEDGRVSGKYVDLYFAASSGGGEIFLQQRLADSETAYEVGTDGKVEEVAVNGAAGVFINGKAIEWEANGVLYGLNGSGLTKKELLKSAESIR